MLIGLGHLLLAVTLLEFMLTNKNRKEGLAKAKNQWILLQAVRTSDSCS
jgi:hypothetical protein